MPQPSQPVEAIFTAALEIVDAKARTAYLDEACGDDAALRQRVESLLRADAEAGSFLDQPVASLDATSTGMADETDGNNTSTWATELAFLAPCDKPDRLGILRSTTNEYEVIELVGYGGMGAVLRAFDTKLNRIVAIKAMAPQLATNPMAVQRFLREARAAAAVHHDHIVTIFAIDDEHRPPFLVMEFIEGQTLGKKIEVQGALELLPILRIGAQIAAGLAAAHKAGLIHRDVKPNNILLQNGIERVKITDFGLARAADDVEITQPGLVSGTPLYMSPEQAQDGPTDARSDLFSLGSVLYAMCTGRPAFRAETTLGVLRRVCHDTPRPIREINPEIPQWLEAIVEKLLAKNPADRFQSANEVAELLEGHLAHINNPAQTPSPAADEVRSSTHQAASHGRWRTGIVAAACLAVALLSVAGVAQFGGFGQVAKWLGVGAPGEGAGETVVSPNLQQRMRAMPAPFVLGEWKLEGESLVTEGLHRANQMIVFGDPAWSDYDLSVEVRDDFQDPRGKKPMANSIVVLADERGDSRWHVDIGAFDDLNHFDLVPFVPDEDGWKSPARRWLPNRLNGKTGVWHLVEVAVRQSTITVRVDGETIAATSHPQLSRGRVGAASFHVGRARWRNFEVRKPTGELLWKGLPPLPTSTGSTLPAS
jgi:hypothetical protein